MQFLRTGSGSSCGPTAQPGGAESGEAQPGGAGSGEAQPDGAGSGEAQPVAGRRNSGVGRPRPVAGDGYAGDVVCGPHDRYPAGRARAPWGDTYWGGARELAPESSIAGAVITTRRGTVVRTRSGVAGRSRADAIRLTRRKSTAPASTSVRAAQVQLRGCLQNCWGISNREQYQACRTACICSSGSYPATCSALKLAQRP